MLIVMGLMGQTLQQPTFGFYKTIGINLGVDTSTLSGFKGTKGGVSDLAAPNNSAGTPSASFGAATNIEQFGNKLHVVTLAHLETFTIPTGITKLSDLSGIVGTSPLAAFAKTDPITAVAISETELIILSEATPAITYIGTTVATPIAAYTFDAANVGVSLKCTPTTCYAIASVQGATAADLGILELPLTKLRTNSALTGLRALGSTATPPVLG